MEKETIFSIGINSFDPEWQQFPPGFCFPLSELQQRIGRGFVHAVKGTVRSRSHGSKRFGLFQHPFKEQPSIRHDAVSPDPVAGIGVETSSVRCQFPDTARGERDQVIFQNDRFSLLPSGGGKNGIIRGKIQKFLFDAEHIHHISGRNQPAGVCGCAILQGEELDPIAPGPACRPDQCIARKDHRSVLTMGEKELHRIIDRRFIRCEKTGIRHFQRFRFVCGNRWGCCFLLFRSLYGEESTGRQQHCQKQNCTATQDHRHQPLTGRRITPASARMRREVPSME